MPVRRAITQNLYRDSVVLMRLAADLEALDGITRASAVMATPANLDMLGETEIAAGPNDLLVIIEGDDKAALDAALLVARARLTAAADTAAEGIGFGTRPRPRGLAEAAALDPRANLALISCPGEYATAEAMKALRLDLDVMVFSDNVSVADEVALKREAAARGRLVMGPDCGTAIIAGMPLGFANAVRRGPVGIVAASGTGLQHLACALDRAGSGISHAIGTGGRDLSDEVGAATTLAAIAMLAADPGTATIVVISKPPGEAAAKRVIEACAAAQKPCVICFIVMPPLARIPPGLRFAATLEDAALAATGAVIVPAKALPQVRPGRKLVGLYSGGTLCHEARAIAAPAVADLELLDLGDDAYTRGRPHPMIDFTTRCGHIRAAAADPAVGVILLDVVLGSGAHADPAAALVPAIGAARAGAGDLQFVAFVCGTEADPQGLASQETLLAEAGVVLAPSNAAAVRAAIALLAQAR